MNAKSPLRIKFEDEIDDLGWQELARHFAAGRVYRVAGQLDLISVAEAMALNRLDLLKNWVDKEQLALPGDAEFSDWMQRNAKFQVLIVSPFVLVQELGE